MKYFIFQEKKQNLQLFGQKMHLSCDLLLLYYSVFISFIHYYVFLKPNFPENFKTSEVAFLGYELVVEYFDLLL